MKKASEFAARARERKGPAAHATLAERCARLARESGGAWRGTATELASALGMEGANPSKLSKDVAGCGLESAGASMRRETRGKRTTIVISAEA